MHVPGQAAAHAKANEVMKYPVTLFVTLLAIAHGPVHGRVKGGEVVEPAATYARFVAAIREAESPRLSDEEIGGYIEEDVLSDLVRLSKEDRKARASMFDECGILDVTGCFVWSNRETAMRAIDDEADLACLVFSRLDEEWTNAAYVFMVRQGDAWRFAGSRRLAIDKASLRAQPDLKSRCWNE